MIDTQDLVPAGGAGCHADQRFGDFQPLGDKCLDRPVGLVVLGHCPDADLQACLAGIVGRGTVDPVGRCRRREPDRKLDPVLEDPAAGVQRNIGAIDVAIKVRTKKIAINSTIGEISSPPKSGSTRRMGLSAGSVAL